MSFCPNCGSQVQEDDDFCGNCGAKLGGGNAQLQQDAVSKQAKQTLNVFWRMLVKPVSTMKEVISTLDQKTTLITGVVLALIQGLFSFWKMHQFTAVLGKTIVKLASAVGKVISTLDGSTFSAGDLAGITSGYNQFKNFIKMPYGNAFMHGIILYLVIFAVLYIGIYATIKWLSKSAVNTLSIQKVAIFATIPALGAELIGTILAYASSALGMFILLVGILVSLAVVIRSFSELAEIDDDKLVYAVPVVFTIVIACSLFAIYKFIAADANSVKTTLMKAVTSGLLN